ncbi:hypothetical protein G9U51_11735 [Calidifontibacter sp. DB0510]|uniref:Putative Flp pilus-assembly TadG-like N-terminal domain-containing protein n=1 Tax=Metallococcus carri TaxID=1656884 RepID=A0A967EB03_9MICO|nr:pilus assembly protein TadG-related protein [Metallococcus carri]NHN56449.1 hypothetical protein [Metallococcus carri]NOP36073.1 hypothetical protein [Calidifontibacter sp. DB2511S]
MIRRLRSRWRAARQRRREEGRILLLGAGLFALLGLLVVGGVDVTAVQLAKLRVLDAADAAALNAADDADPTDLYKGGVGTGIPLTAGRVATSARTSLSRQDRPAHVTNWAVTSASAPDGTTAVVGLTATVDPPLSGRFLRAIGADVTVRVESRARSVVR